ncbi:MAG: hypothetical protein JNK41_04505 [Saprospiraceae bacterium]|nr:hypothetical protein [Saprospiraceae bacterium]
MNRYNKIFIAIFTLFHLSCVNNEKDFIELFYENTQLSTKLKITHIEHRYLDKDGWFKSDPGFVYEAVVNAKEFDSLKSEIMNNKKIQSYNFETRLKYKNDLNTWFIFGDTLLQSIDKTSLDGCDYEILLLLSEHKIFINTFCLY